MRVLALSRRCLLVHTGPLLAHVKKAALRRIYIQIALSLNYGDFLAGRSLIIIEGSIPPVRSAIDEWRQCWLIQRRGVFP